MGERPLKRCMRCDEMTTHWLCARCEADEIDNRDCDEIDGPDEIPFDCGMMPDGTCLLAGTEECDWECPRNA